MARRGKAEPWQARAPFWIGLAMTAVGGFVTVKSQLSAMEARHEARNREVAVIQARLTVVESRCR